MFCIIASIRELGIVKLYVPVTGLWKWCLYLDSFLVPAQKDVLEVYLLPYNFQEYY